MADRGLLLPITVAAVGLAGIFVAEDLPTRHSVETKLTDRSMAALTQAGITHATVSFTGRDGTVSVLSISDADQARTIVAGQEGVRVAKVQVVSALPGGTPMVTITSTPSPTGGAGGPTATSSPQPSPTAAPSPSPTASPTPNPADLEAQIKAAGSIQFNFGSAVLTGDSHKTIAKIAAILKANPDVRVRIEGNTDSTGSAATNLVLSKARADAVYAALVKLGVDASRMTTIGYGETHPLVPNTTDANRAINRRVIFRVS